jgi:hypothetical protein
MLTRVKEMIDALHSRPNASAGFTAKEVYEVGQAYGLTCREIGQNFLGKSKSIGYSRYLPQMPPAEVLEAALKAGPSKRGRKPGSTKKAVAKKVAKPVETETEVENVEEAQQFDASPTDGEVFCWIATPQELTEDLEIEPAKKAKRASKPRKVKVS